MNVPQPPQAAVQQPAVVNLARANQIIVDHAVVVEQQQQQRRAQQERTDDELARRLGRMMQDDPPPPVEYGVGNAAGHFMNEDFRMRAGVLLSDRFHPAQEQAANRLVAEHRNNNNYNNNGGALPPYVSPVAAVAHAQQAPRRASMLAGMTRGQTAEGRVDEWRRYVE